MKLDLSNIRGGEQQKIELDFTVDLEDIDYYGDLFKIKKPVSVLGNLFNMKEEIYLTCKLSTNLQVHCARCLLAFDYPLETNINAKLLAQNEYEDSDYDDQDDIILYEDQIVDFSELVREQIITALPMKVVCRENCKGLCKSCGSNLNLTTCQCDMDDDGGIDPRMAKLKELL